MEIFSEIVVTRIIFILGIVNLVTAATIALTCRCIPGLKIIGKLMKYPAYKKLYKYHCYIWWVFWPSVVVHAIVAVSYLGIPF